MIFLRRNVLCVSENKGWRNRNPDSVPLEIDKKKKVNKLSESQKRVFHPREIVQAGGVSTVCPGVEREPRAEVDRRKSEKLAESTRTSKAWADRRRGVH